MASLQAPRMPSMEPPKAAVSLHADGPTHEPTMSVIRLPHPRPATFTQLPAFSQALGSMQELSTAPIVPPKLAAFRHALVPMHDEVPLATSPPKPARTMQAASPWHESARVPIVPPLNAMVRHEFAPRQLRYTPSTLPD